MLETKKTNHRCSTKKGAEMNSQKEFNHEIEGRKKASTHHSSRSPRTHLCSSCYHAPEPGTARWHSQPPPGYLTRSPAIPRSPRRSSHSCRTRSAPPWACRSLSGCRQTPPASCSAAPAGGTTRLALPHSVHSWKGTSSLPPPWPHTSCPPWCRSRLAWQSSTRRWREQTHCWTQIQGRVEMHWQTWKCWRTQRYWLSLREQRWHYVRPSIRMNGDEHSNVVEIHHKRNQRFPKSFCVEVPLCKQNGPHSYKSVAAVSAGANIV